MFENNTVNRYRNVLYGCYDGEITDHSCFCVRL